MTATADARPPMHWVRAALALADEHGYSLPDLAKLAGEQYLNVYRLSRGEGSVRTAVAVRRALIALGERPPLLVIDPADGPEAAARNAHAREEALRLFAECFDAAADRYGIVFAEAAVEALRGLARGLQ